MSREEHLAKLTVWKQVRRIIESESGSNRHTGPSSPARRQRHGAPYSLYELWGSARSFRPPVRSPGVQEHPVCTSSPIRGAYAAQQVAGREAGPRVWAWNAVCQLGGAQGVPVILCVWIKTIAIAIHTCVTCVCDRVLVTQNSREAI